MPRVAPLTQENASEASKELLDVVQNKFGMVPNLLATLAHSPAALQMHLAMAQALESTSIHATLRESVALAVAATNRCNYCGAAHTAIGKMVGLSADEMTANLRGQSSDPKTQAALDLAIAIVKDRGWVSDADLQTARDAALNETEIAEIIAVTIFNTYTNYSNHIFETEIDFPKVDLPEAITA
ncbi:MAG: carboxymuconolactone decarboxylase family protein [Planctomycetota bacterium]|jgi:uncharacterized peroxidase-related enzyme